MAEWTDVDQRVAAMIYQFFVEALDMADDETMVEHFVIGASVGSGKPDGKPRRVFVTTCCRDCGQPTHLMNHVMELLGSRN